MAKVEIDEAEYNRLSALHGIASKIVANPAARKRLEEAHKLVDPSATTPMLDQERQLNEPVNALKTELSTEIAALRKEREDEKRDAAVARIASEQDRGFGRLRAARWTDEGIESVRKIMETKGIADVDDAVAIFERNNPPATPATPSGGMTGSSWGFTDVNTDTDKSIQDLIATKGQVDSISDRMAMSALNEFRQAARR
jgi:hypothetical protein